MIDVLQLESNEVHLWFVKDGEIDETRVKSEHSALLTTEELERAGRFRFAKHRKQYQITRASARAVLSKYLPLAPLDIRFADNRYGRPGIENAENAAAKIEFNISHTANLIVLAIARERLIGIDVENVVDRRVDVNNADDYFAEAEAAELRSMSEAQRHDRFFEYWTLKESYIKARGMGLSIPLDGFAFSLAETGNVRVAFQASLGDSPDQWHFRQYRLWSDYIVALCCARQCAEPPSITAFEFASIEMHATMNLTATRTSD